MRSLTFVNAPVSSRMGSLLAFSVLLLSSVRAQDRTTEAGEASIKDAATECTPYSYEPVVSKLSLFPAIWQPATIVAGDTAATDKWNSIASSVPTNIPMKGTDMGDFSNFTPTYSPDDPDCWWTFDQCVTPKLPGLPPDIASVPEPHTLGYGFDDGPNCSHNAFYDYLTSQNQKATMYFIGSNVMDWPLEAARALTDGHEICVHTWAHRYMTALTSQNAFAELYYTIKLATGVTPTCWRPPFGDVDDRIRAIAHGLGLRTILWKFDSNDWKAGTGNITPADVDADYQSLIDHANNGTFDTVGAIILTHELNNFTMSEAIKFYPQLKSAFKSIVPVGVGLNITQPYVETNYSLPSFEQYISGTTTTTGGPANPSSPSSPSSPSPSAGGGTKKPTGGALSSSLTSMTLVTVGIAATSVFAILL